jgi:ribosomal protein S18 acetylase RimI-like enzyme
MCRHILREILRLIVHGLSEGREAMPTGCDATVVVRSLEESDAAECDAIILTLPHHFGIEAGRQQCAHDVRTHRGLVAVLDGRVVGFLTIACHFPTTVEITWMAVHADYRRRGIGHALIASLCKQLRNEGVRLLLVMTVAASDTGDTAGGYEDTRRFYEQVGFLPARELPNYWPSNVALLLVRPLYLPDP